MFSPEVQAEYVDIATEIPQDGHQYINLTDKNGGSDAAADGGTGTRLTQSWVKFYTTDNSSGKQLQIDVVDRGVGPTFACRDYLVRIDYPSGSQTIAPNRCVGESGYSPTYMTVPSYSFSPEPGIPRTPTGQTVYSAVMSFTIISQPGASAPYHTATLRLKATSNGHVDYLGSNTRIVIYPSKEGSTGSGTLPVAQRPPRDHIIRFDFKPPCNTNHYGQTREIRWFDADENEANQSAGLTARFIEYYDSDANNVASSTTILNVGDNGSHSFSVTPNRKYSLVFENVWGGNGIAAEFPYDAANFDLPCRPGGAVLDIGCNFTRVKAWDSHDENQLVNYQILYEPGVYGSNNFVPLSLSGGTGRTNIDTPDTRTASLSSAFGASGRDIRFILQVRDIQTGVYVSVPSSPQTFNRRCGGGTPSYSLDVTCSGVWVRNLQDPDDRGSGINIEGTFYPRNSGGGFGAALGVFSMPNQSGDVFIAWPWDKENQKPWNQRNAGWKAVFRTFDIDSNGNSVGTAVANFDAIIEGSCYQASCSVDVVSQITGVANGVQAGRQFTTNVTVSNPAADVPARVIRLSDNVNFTATTPNNNLPGAFATGAPLSLRGSYAGNGFLQDYPEQSDPVVRGTSQTGPLYFNAPGARGTASLTMYPDYPDTMALGAQCAGETSVQFYQPFLLVPEANTPNGSPDSENPESISYSTSLSQTETGNLNGSPYTSDDIPTTGTSSLRYYRQGTYRPNDFLSQAISGSYGSPLPGTPFSSGSPWNDSVAGRGFIHGGTSDTWQPGDRYCSWININPASGWIGPGGDLRDTQPGQDIECAEVQNRPYVRAYGADVFGGGQFGTAGGAGGIDTYYKDGSQGAGSGVEFAAFAIDNIRGFASASLRGASSPLPPDGLTFANTGPGSPGNFVNSRAVPDYFANALKPETVQTSAPSVNINAATYVDKQQTLIDTGGGSIHFNPGAVQGLNYNKHHTFFVIGDVVIRNDITYANTGNYGSIAQIPSFALFVKGNIYIERNVTQLSGLFVAQPHNGVGGTIYTCSDQSGNLYGQTDLYTRCGNKLRVNGAFVSQHLKLLRTHKTLSDIPFVGPGIYKDETFDDENSAESFRILPEFFLASPVFRADGSQTNGKYDYITTLPPIL